MKFSSTALLSLSALAFAHPGHEESEHELIYKREFNKQTRRGLNACSEKLEKRGVNGRAAARRAATVEKYRRNLGLQVRDTASVANTSHLVNESYTPYITPSDELFTDSNTCVVNPEGEVGPFFVKGEYIRSNLREGQPGFPIVIEAQILDVETCEPITNAWWDVWNCNATGVYSGVVQSGNGDANDLANINATWLRGLQHTDSDGVVQFETVFPGHYSGRATHHHMVVHINATIQQNLTLTGGTASHIGQLFWDQDLITKVEATYPYNTNNITITENSVDRVFATETEDTTSDPVFNYVYLGNDLSDGLFGWVTVVVNTSATHDPSYSFALTEDGGVEESGGDTDIPNGGSVGGNGTMPTGGMPSGSMAGSAPTGTMASGAPAR